MSSSNSDKTLPDLAAELNRKLEEVRSKVERLERERDDAYKQRDLVVALLARLSIADRWPAGTGTDDTEKDPRWKRVVFIETPEGQISWHFPEEEGYLFDGLPVHAKSWDGHTNDQKTARIERCVAQIDHLNEQMMRGRARS